MQSVVPVGVPFSTRSLQNSKKPDIKKFILKENRTFGIGHINWLPVFSMHETLQSETWFAELRPDLMMDCKIMPSLDPVDHHKWMSIKDRPNMNRDSANEHLVCRATFRATAGF